MRLYVVYQERSQRNALVLKLFACAGGCCVSHLCQMVTLCHTYYVKTCQHKDDYVGVEILTRADGTFGTKGIPVNYHLQFRTCSVAHPA